MKKLLVVLALLLCFGVEAQDKAPQHRGKKPFKIEKFVSDLSASQKKQLDEITSASKQRVDVIEKDLRAVRDSIRNIMNTYGDHSKQLDPLFNREAQLQVNISREMYAAKVQMDKVLTKAQYDTLHQKLKEHRAHKHQGKDQFKKSGLKMQKRMKHDAKPVQEKK